jgi:hypothetical protein
LIKPMFGLLLAAFSSAGVNLSRTEVSATEDSTEGQMVGIDEELEAAKQAQAVISTLPISSALDPNIVATLRRVKDVAAQAISIFPSEALLNDARDKVVRAVYDLIRNPATQEKIDNAKGVIGVWTLRLRPSGD